MSRPATFVLPPCARALTLGTSRGEFAAIEARPEGEVRGSALLLPGFTGSKEDFIELLEPLAGAGWRVVAVDGRGQYETPGPADEHAYSQGELALDLLAVAGAVAAGAGTPAGTPGGASPDGGVHLLGHSLGGQIARAAVLLDPAPFRTLTLMSSGPARISESQELRIRMLSEALRTMTMERVWEATLAFEAAEAARNGLPPVPVREDLRARWLRTHPLQLLTTGHQLTVEPDRVDALAAVPSLPRHVLSGSHDDAWPVPLLDEMARRLGAHRTVVDGADHSPNTDRPAATATAVAEFWHRH
jgi:pimeloyl-ACP methyl ester carboxylesterase